MLFQPAGPVPLAATPPAGGLPSTNFPSHSSSIRVQRGGKIHIRVPKGNCVKMPVQGGAFKNGAGTASSPRFVCSTAFFGDAPSPPLLARFLVRSLEARARAGANEPVAGSGSCDKVPQNSAQKLNFARRRSVCPNSGIRTTV